MSGFMPYIKTNWTEATPITAQLLNNIETGVSYSYSYIKSSTADSTPNTLVWRDGAGKSSFKNLVVDQALSVGGTSELGHVQLRSGATLKGMTPSGSSKYLLNITTDAKLDIGTADLETVILSNSVPKWWNGSIMNSIYTTGNKPTPADIGALATNHPSARLSWNGSRISIDGGSNNAAVNYADTADNANRIAGKLFRVGNYTAGANGYITFGY